jgi:molecular chaperone DnaK
MAASNRLLGEFNLEGIPPQPRGIPQIEVKFDIDQNGILSVSARELGTGKEAKVQIKEASGLDSSEIEQMRKDAEANADEDRKQFELAESRNKASQIIYQCEKLMKENEDKLTASDREPMNKAIEKLKTASAGNDASTIRQATDELNAASQAFSKIIYDRSTDSSSIKENQKSTNAKDDDAIDAEFEIKD